MLRNVNKSIEKLQSLGFSVEKVNKTEHVTILTNGDTTAEVIPNGNVRINNTEFPFKKVMHGKITF